MSANGGEGVRLDKWLWAARFFKTRRLATEAIKGGKVEVDGQRAKPAREVHAGQTVHVTKGAYAFEVVVEGVSGQRGPASQAQALYTETAESVERREAIRQERRAAEAAIPRVDHRPDRRDRRELARFKRGRG
ncbi:RNA-binding S4 domain-containing protein [Arhodomonas sp. SL1]|uniref:RNA-binding S4 domain-containing protein n=1 Tax=Arhodomonas sp. SL1 TaxID=3425691 RepID=UPI003F88223F